MEDLTPVTNSDQFSAAILEELKAIRKLLEKPTPVPTEDVRVKEPAKRR